MGKKKGNSIHCQNKDVMQRMNYLYQAAQTACLMKPPNLALAQYYAANMKSLSHKKTIKMSPHLKRSICKRCCMPLIPTLTSKIKFLKDKKVGIECTKCGFFKRYPSKKKKGERYTLWSDKAENITATITLCSGPSKTDFQNLKKS